MSASAETVTMTETVHNTVTQTMTEVLYFLFGIIAAYIK